MTSISLFFLAAGILTSVTVLSAYQVLFTIPLIYYFYLAFKERKFQLPKSAWFLIAFTLIALVSLILNFELVPRPTKNFGRLKYFIYGFSGIFVFKIWIKEATEKTKRYLANTFFASVIIAGFYAMYNYSISPDGRAKGITDTMRYGYGSGMFLLTILSALLHRNKIKSWFDWKIASLAFCIGFIGMYLTFTRGALLGFLCGLPFVIYFYKRKLGLIFGGVALLGVLSLVGIYFYGSGNYQNRFLTNKNNSSDVIRRSQWKAALIATQERPILGWGLSNFHSQLKRIKYEYDLDAKDYDDAHSHNLFLEISSGTGLIGLTIFLAWLVFWAFEMLSANRSVRALVMPFGVAFVVSSQFEVTFDANNATMIFFLYALSTAWSLNVKPS
jgi:O-antigen ligase